jgi:cytochrome c556
VVSAVALDDVAKVQLAVAHIHGTMEKTQQGVKAGTVTLKKNAARIKEFVRMDKAFHEKLTALDRAAHHKNKKELLRITKQLLDGCVQCHQTFR